MFLSLPFFVFLFSFSVLRNRHVANSPCDHRTELLYREKEKFHRLLEFLFRIYISVGTSERIESSCFLFIKNYCTVRALYFEYFTSVNLNFWLRACPRFFFLLSIFASSLLTYSQLRPRPDRSRRTDEIYKRTRKKIDWRESLPKTPGSRAERALAVVRYGNGNEANQRLTVDGRENDREKVLVVKAPL